MNQSKYPLQLLLLLGFVILLTFGCTAKDNPENEYTIEGYILEVDKGKVLVAYDIPVETYNEIKGKSVVEIGNKDEHIPLIYLGYKNSNKLKEGQRVTVWIDGGVDDSYPQQAGAKKIEVVE